LDILHGHGQEVGGEQTGLNRFMNNTRPSTGGVRWDRRIQWGRRICDNIDEEIVVGVELEKKVCEVNEDEDN